MQTEIFNLNTPHYQNILQDFVRDIYHHPGYILSEANRVSAQAAAISISDGSKRFLLPYLLRQCPENICLENTCESVLDRPIYDVVSPYGYPGVLLNDDARCDPAFLRRAIAALITAFQANQICSAFIRLHPILNAEIQNTLIDSGIFANGTTVSINLTLSDAEQRHQIQSSRRNLINRCRRRGFQATISSFSQGHIIAFMSVYQNTMDRLNASETYYFDRSYYESLIQLEPHIFICCIEFEGVLICAGLFTECCGIVQYHLSGTKTEFLSFTPNTLMLDEVRQWATERGNTVFHLGGGLGSQRDSLFEFKSSFSKQRHDFSTLRLITDTDIYQNLVKIRAKQLNVAPEMLLDSDFFPAYRTQQI